MSNITHIVYHYSATFDDQDIRERDINEMHLARGWSGTGYHYVSPLDGSIETGRSPETRTGAHVGGQNRGKIGICMIGGLKRASGANVGHDTRTRAQLDAQIKLTHDLLARHPQAKIVGHRDLKSTQCPGYDAAAWWASVSGQGAPYTPAPDTSAPAVSYAMVKRGSRGNAVRVLQNALKVLGYAIGTVDGAFGPKTEAALQAFQRDANITADGVVGPVTWAELLKAR